MPLWRSQPGFLWDPLNDSVFFEGENFPRKGTPYPVLDKCENIPSRFESFSPSPHFTLRMRQNVYFSCFCLNTKSCFWYEKNFSVEKSYLACIFCAFIGKLGTYQLGWPQTTWNQAIFRGVRRRRACQRSKGTKQTTTVKRWCLLFNHVFSLLRRLGLDRLNFHWGVSNWFEAVPTDMYPKISIVSNLSYLQKSLIFLMSLTKFLE